MMSTQNNTQNRYQLDRHVPSPTLHYDPYHPTVNALLRARLEALSYLITQSHVYENNQLRCGYRRRIVTILAQRPIAVLRIDSLFSRLSQIAALNGMTLALLPENLDVWLTILYWVFIEARRGLEGFQRLSILAPNGIIEEWKEDMKADLVMRCGAVRDVCRMDIERFHWLRSLA